MRKTILVVDDNKINRELMRGILEGEYKVIEAEDGAVALDILRSNSVHIDAVVLDIMMPVMNGYQLLAEMRLNKAYSSIPVIVSTGSEGEEAEIKALSVGANDFLPKPFQADIIKHRISNLISLAQAESDVEKLRAEKEALRISEEQYRIASSVGGRKTARYDIRTGIYYTANQPLTTFSYGQQVENVPQSFIDSGIISRDCVQEYKLFYERIRSGEPNASVDVKIKTRPNEYRWHNCEATVIFGDDNRPSQAIIVYTDITEQREKEGIYTKWHQALESRPLKSYTLFRCNLSDTISHQSVEGLLLNKRIKDDSISFNQQTQEYALLYVHPEDREQYISVVDSNTLMANYHRNKRIEVIEYREMLSENKVRWIRLTIELVEFPNSNDVEAYLMFEDIDKVKRAQLKAKELAEQDPLTALLNRAAFAQKVEQIIKKKPHTEHAFLMLDIDGFKPLNDAFGHAAGDQALINVAGILRSLIRSDDLVGRLGGDEFMIFLTDVTYKAAIEKKAKEICNLTRKAFSTTVHISSSIGIATFPNDGKDFETLYHNADNALYRVKDAGKDSFAFYNSNMQDGTDTGQVKSAKMVDTAKSKNKQHMLIVDDNDINRMLLAELFKDEFIIDMASDGEAALTQLRRFGSNTAIVLLDLVMPGIDGFEVLDKMRENVDTKSIPVIVVSGQEEMANSLRAIQAGAVDFVTKPVDAALIRVRVDSAMARVESERLRAQNYYLLLQSNEELKYRSVLHSTGTVVIELDWAVGLFTYDDLITKHIAGVYDNRPLWQILTADGVAMASDVQSMRTLVNEVANDRARDSAEMNVQLKTPLGRKEWFCMHIYKQMDDFQLTTKLIITYVNINEEVIADQKLRYQAEKDGLTGLWNRNTFFQKASVMINAKKAGSYVVACFDIDNFKVINDQYGSKKGDDLLKFVADTFADTFDAAGGIVGRVDADNFVVLYPTRFVNSNKLKTTLDAVAAFDGSIPPISFSIGRYIADDLSLPISSMYDRATLAQSTIKGRFDVHVALYDESMRKDLLQEQKIINEMNGALEGRQFEVWFQPQYNHSTGARIGAEALVRWRHPQLGLVPPYRFIPIFERNGFIYELDKYVWERTCQYLRTWTDTGLDPLPISVNISRYDLLRDDLYLTITGLLKKYNLPQSLLRLEITESAFATDSQRIIAVVKKFINSGFTIEIDDFGSGYSSLNTLKDVPAQVLKMDMRFLERVQGNVDDEDELHLSRSGNILESVVRMAKWLGMSVIAEGVETITQADYLKSIGCDYIQGYLYAKPMPAEEYERTCIGDDKEEKLLSIESVENYDNNKFWDPESLDTLVFNTYVGGACIVELQNNRAEILRTNDKFAKMVGGDKCTIKDILSVNIPQKIDADSERLFFTMLESALITGEDVEGELRFVSVFVEGEETYLRVTMRVIARASTRSLFYLSCFNTTQQRLAERQKANIQQQLSIIMANVSGAISAITIDKQDKMHLVFANEGYYSLLGYSREQYDAESILPMNTVVPEDTVRMKRIVSDLYKNGGKASYEYRCYKRNGEVVYMRTNASVTKLGGIDEPVLISVSLDVTAEKLAENHIRQLNRNLQTMMDDMPGGFARLKVLSNGNLATEYVNDSFCRMRGMSREQIMANDKYSAMSTIHADDVELVRSNLYEMVATGEVRAIKYRLLHASGQYIPYNALGRVTKNESGELILNVYYTAMDVEEQKELALSQMLPVVLSTIMQSTADLSFVKDKNYRYLNCSRSFALMTGHSDVSQIIGKTDYDLFPKDIADQYRADDLRLCSTGQSLVDYIERLPAVNNVQRYSSTSKYLIKDGVGEIVGIYGVGRDVTESRTTYEHLSLLANNTPCGLVSYALTPDGLRVIYFNDGMCKLFDCTREEYEQATQNAVMTTVFKEDVPRLQAQIEHMLKQGEPVNCTYRIHTFSNKAVKWVNLRAAPMETHGGLLQANAVLYDVTEQKLAENTALVHEQEMRFAISQMGKMLCEYDPVTHTLVVPEGYSKRYNMPSVVHDVPDSLINSKVIAEQTVEQYKAFYDAILRGEKTGEVEICEIYADGSQHWEKMVFSSVFDDYGTPIKTIIAVEETTQQHIQYELEHARPTMGEDNLLVHALFNLNTGETLDYAYADGTRVPKQERTAFLHGGDNLENIIVDDEERARYRELNDTKHLFYLYNKGITEQSIDYRRRMINGEIIWVRNKLRMIRKPGSSDILLFEYCYNIEREKTRELIYTVFLAESYDYVATINAKSGQFDIITDTNNRDYVPSIHSGSIDKAVDNSVEQYVHPDDREVLQKYATIKGLTEQLKHTDRLQFVFRILLPNGEMHYKKVTVYYLDRNRDLVVMAREDVTDLMRGGVMANRGK